MLLRNLDPANGDVQRDEIHPEARGVEGLAGVRDEGSSAAASAWCGCHASSSRPRTTSPVPVDEDTVPRPTRLRHDREQVAGADDSGARRVVPPPTGVFPRPALRRGQSHDGREQPAPVHPDGGTPRAGHGTQRAGHGQSGRQRRLRRGAERIDERIIIQYTSTSIIILLGSYCLPVRSGPPTK